MASNDFLAWHKRHGFTYDSGAAALGLSRATYARYLKNPEPPRWLLLACIGYDALDRV